MPGETSSFFKRISQLNFRDKRKFWGGLLLLVGFLLSPLSWWNDVFINLPLALGFAWLVSLVYKPAFGASLIVGYWLTNLLGFILMHKGGEKLLGTEDKTKEKREILKDVLISIGYTAILLLLIHFKVLQPLDSYSFK